MRKNKFLAGLLLICGFSLLTPEAQANQATIKKGLKAITGPAIKGPQVDCEVNARAPLTSGYSNQGADCSTFIQADGSLGPLGRVISTHIDSMGNNSLFHSRNLPAAIAVCPRWSSFTNEQRDHFWVWLMAAISFKETTCGANTVNKAATHGTAIGHLQLNKHRKDRAWRGGESGKSCAVQDVSSPAANMKCGLEILHEQLKGKNGLYKGNGNLFGRGANSYWQELRQKNGGTVIKLVKSYPACK